MDNSFKKHVVMWAIHAMDLGSHLNSEDGMWQLYYSLPNEEIQSLIKELQEEGLILIKSTKSGNRIYPTLMLSDEGKLLLQRGVQYIDSFNAQDLDIDRLDDILNGVIAFLNIDQQTPGDHLNLLNIISDLTIKSHESQCLIKYLNMYGDISIMCSSGYYLNMFISQNKKYLREFLGMLPEIEAAIFRYDYGIYDLFYRDISDIMEYYDLDNEEVDAYKENVLSKYGSVEWYNNSIWVRQIVDCFFRLSMGREAQVSNRW